MNSSSVIELKHLRTLLALKRSGSLVEAAEQLFLTQSALSHQLKELESRLDVSLFVRKSRPLRFSMAGLRLLQLAEELLPMVAAAERDITRLAGGESGRLHMAIECHSCFNWLMPAIDAFRDHWPEVEVDLIGAFIFSPLAALLRGELDLVVTSDPQPLPGVCYQPLFAYQSMLALSRHHVLAQKAYIEPEDLATEVLITYPVDSDRLDVFNQFLDPAGVEPAAIRKAELTVMMAQLVASGRGVAALPNWALTEYLERDYLLAKPLGEKGVWPTLYAAIREESQQLNYMKDFLSTAQSCCFATLKGIKPVAE